MFFLGNAHHLYIHVHGYLLTSFFQPHVTLYLHCLQHKPSQPTSLVPNGFGPTKSALETTDHLALELFAASTIPSFLKPQSLPTYL